MFISALQKYKLVLLSRKLEYKKRNREKIKKTEGKLFY